LPADVERKKASGFGGGKELSGRLKGMEVQVAAEPADNRVVAEKRPFLRTKGHLQREGIMPVGKGEKGKKKGFFPKRKDLSVFGGKGKGLSPGGGPARSLVQGGKKREEKKLHRGVHFPLARRGKEDRRGGRTYFGQKEERKKGRV